ncbi:hypothetical protein [Domibacillus aminovorans]|uniref:Stage VI sporulation protein D N-terminal domain-containing protein n=1 Tax=Domibacillus aminovorans TaxID=29332 RepID=A0A177LBS2_9BACI|nr:hypothetical protein [Domibacillus aminovorans]OAH62702.1 hypothetical protein AWH49_08530 [Domibacillus aminovorans]
MDELFFVSIEEGVVFPDGESVEELLSISLDPQLTMDSKDEGTVLTGTIEVTGEYCIVTEEEENIRQFFRHIPVHAFIPPDRRIADDTDIQIHSFDYDVQKPDRLVLAAELAVVVSLKEEETVFEFDSNSNEEHEDSVEEASVEEHVEIVEEASVEEHEDSVEEAASVQVQKGHTEEPSIFSWLEERSEHQAEWRFSIEPSGDVALISTQDEAPPQEE